MSPARATYGWARRLALVFYIAGLQVWFRTVKVPLSRAVGYFRDGIEPVAREFPNLDEFATWWQAHARWQADPFNGVLDMFPTLRQAELQLSRRACVQDDCDGLAYVAANQLHSQRDTAEEVYVVTIITDPISWEQDALAMAAHVICVFRHQGQWRIVSNETLFAETWADLEAALIDNPYTRGHPVLFYEVRTPALKFVRSRRFPLRNLTPAAQKKL